MRFIVFIDKNASASDSSALGVALDLRSAFGSGSSVSVALIGDDTSSATLEESLECGADDAYLLSDPAFTGSDTHGIARIQQAFVNKVAPDDFIVLTQCVDDPVLSTVPASLAGLLGTQQFYYVTGLSCIGSDVTCVQDYRDSSRTCRVPSGSVVSLDSSFPSRRLDHVGKPGGYEKMDRVALCLGMYSVGAAGARVIPVGKEGI